jgi:hypothetical protein
LYGYTDKKDKSNFPHKYREIQNGAVAKSYMTNGLLIQYMGKYWSISPHIRKTSSYMTLQLLHSEFPRYEENLIFFFISVYTHVEAIKENYSHLYFMEKFFSLRVT